MIQYLFSIADFKYQILVGGLDLQFYVLLIPAASEKSSAGFSIQNYYHFLFHTTRDRDMPHAPMPLFLKALPYIYKDIYH